MENRDGVLTVAQIMVEYAEDLVTASPKESFSRIEMLILLNAVKNDRHLIAQLALCDQTIVKCRIDSFVSDASDLGSDGFRQDRR
jgi:hypothetical protein